MGTFNAIQLTLRIRHYYLSELTFFLLLFYNFNLINAQISFRANKLDHKSGFNCGFANKVLEDHYGFLWIGCYNGLYRYDHTQSRAFVPHPGDPNSQAMYSISGMMLSRTYNEIILFPSHGISTLHLDSYKISNHLDSLDARFRGMKFDFIHQINDSTALSVVYDGSTLLHFAKITRSGQGVIIAPLRRVKTDEEYHINSFRRFYYLPIEDGSGRYYLFADRYVFICDLQDLTMRHHYSFNLVPNDKKFENQIVVAEKLNHQRCLVSIAGYGLIEYDPLTNTVNCFKRLEDPNNNFFTIYRDHEQIIWLGTTHGDIYTLRPESGLFESVTLIGVDLRKAYIKNIYRNSGNLLLISTSIGVFASSLSENFFRKLSLQDWFEHKINFIQNAFVHPKLPVIYLDDASYQNIHAAHFDAKKVRRTNLPASSYHKKNAFHYYGKEHLLYWNEGDIYISQADYTEFKKWQHPKWLELVQKKYRAINSIFADRSGYVLASYLGGLWVLHPSGNISELKLDKNDLRWHEIKWAAFDEGHCYLIFDDAVYIWDFKQGNLTQIIDQSNNPLRKKWTSIFKFNTTLILSAINGGVSIWDLNKDTWQNYNPANSFTQKYTNIIQHASMDQDSIIWYSSDLGLVNYNFRYNSFTLYLFDLNLSNIQIYRPLVSNSTGLYCIGHQIEVDYTLNMYKPQKPASALLEVSSLKVNNQELVTGAFYTKNFLSLENYENNLEITWYFSNPEGLSYYTYRYRLLGLHDDFEYGKDIKPLKYLKIPPGKYQLQIDYIFDPTNEVIASRILDLRIKYPWYQTWWFYTLIFTLIGGIAFFIGYQKIKSVRREAAIQSSYERELSDMKLAILRMQMNPHFMFNALNSIKSYILKNEPSLASRYLSQFSQLFRSILQFSMEKYISLKEELQSLKIYVELEQLRVADSFEFTIKIDESIELDEVRIQPLLLQPFVENAIWHGLANKQGLKKLEIEIERFDEILIIKI